MDALGHRGLSKLANAHVSQSGLLNFKFAQHRRTALWASTRLFDHCQSQHSVASSLKCEFVIFSADERAFVIRAGSCNLYLAAFSAYISFTRIQRGEVTTSSPRKMNSRFVVMVELPEMSCSPQTLEHIVGQVRKFFDRLSSELRASTGQHLRAT